MEQEFDIRDCISTESLESIEGIETLIDLQKVIDNLPLREKQIVYLLASGHTQVEIAEKVGLSDRQIRRILKKMSAFSPETA